MLTIPRKLSKERLRGNWRERCNYCSALFLRSDLTRLPNGLLACSWDAKGLTDVELDMLNAQGAARSSGARYSDEDGAI